MSCIQVVHGRPPVTTTPGHAIHPLEKPTHTVPRHTKVMISRSRASVAAVLLLMAGIASAEPSVAFCQQNYKDCSCESIMIAGCGAMEAVKVR